MGISFDVENYFKRIYMYLCDMSTGVTQTFQIAHRVREPEDKRIFITYELSNIYISGINFTDNKILD